MSARERTAAFLRLAEEELAAARSRVPLASLALLGKGVSQALKRVGG
jgi:hypothetical protein